MPKKSTQKQKFDRRILFDYLMDKYSIPKLPKHFFIKMSNIFNGKLEGLNKPIPPEHMYDMWIRKSKYLDKIYQRNASKGNKMEGYLRLNYDLAIIISMYDSYLSWLDKQKISSAENENIKESITITDVLYRNNINNLNNSNNDSIEDILDELI